MATFAERLKKIRKGRKWTQAQLAEKIGVSVSTLSRYETGKSTPNFSTISRYAESLKVTPEWLSGQPVPRKIRPVEPEPPPTVLPDEQDQSVPESVPEVEPLVVEPEPCVMEVEPVSPEPEPPLSEFEVVDDSVPSVTIESAPQVRIWEERPRLFAAALVVILLVIIVQSTSAIYIHQLNEQNSRLRAQNAEYQDAVAKKDSEISALGSEVAALQVKISDFERQLVETAAIKYDSGYETGYSEGYDTGYAEGYAIGQSDGKSAAEAEEVEFIQEQLEEQYESGYSAGHDEGYGEGYEIGSSDGYDRGYSSGDSDGYSRGISDASATSVVSSQASSSQTGSWENTSGTYVASSTGYPASTIVYVSNSGKIHLHSSCSGMKNYKTMTLGEAESHSSYSLCKNCF